MSYEWDASSPMDRDADRIQSTSFQNSSFQRRGGRGNPRGNYNNFNSFNRAEGGGGERPFNSFNRSEGGGDRWQNFGRGRFNRNDGGGRPQNGNAKTIKIPSKFVGRVIGKGGSKINDLQFESGARIIVTKEEEDNETVIKLIGSDGEVSKAEELIRDLTVERENRAY